MSDYINTYKDVVDSFGGIAGIVESFGWNISTVYKWLSGRIMGLSHAICINARMPAFSLTSLVGFELECERVYVKLIGFFGSQTATAKALGVSQFTVHSWAHGKVFISAKKAKLLESITNGAFIPSDFKHLGGSVKNA